MIYHYIEHSVIITINNYRKYLITLSIIKKIKIFEDFIKSEKICLILIYTMLLMLLY